MELQNTAFFAWFVLPILIFSARIVDVSIGTLRIVYIARGKKFIVPILGFFEVLIWLVAMGQFFKHLDNVACYIGWAGGFAMGNYVGMYIESKLAIGFQMIRIITRAPHDSLLKDMQTAGYGVTVVDGQGTTGPVKILFTLIMRRDMAEVIEVINRNLPSSFYTIEDVQSAKDAILPATASSRKSYYWRLFKMDRKRK